MASAKAAGYTFGEHHTEPASGFVRFNGLLAVFAHVGGGMGRYDAAGAHRVASGEGNGPRHATGSLMTNE